MTRLKANAKYKSVSVLSQSQHHYDQLIRLGTGYQGNPILSLRLIEIRCGNCWYRYLTSVLDPQVLPPYVVADLYARRWRIEETFNLLKRLLGLSYLWTGSINGVQLQLWATCGATPRYPKVYPLGRRKTQDKGDSVRRMYAHRWIFYVILIDLADEVAEQFALPFDSISVEMVFRGIYHFSVAHHQGSKINDLVLYLTAPENQDLGVVKQTRSARASPHLDLSPSPC